MQVIRESEPKDYPSLDQRKESDERSSQTAQTGDTTTPELPRHFGKRTPSIPDHRGLGPPMTRSTNGKPQCEALEESEGDQTNFFLSNDIVRTTGMGHYTTVPDAFTTSWTSELSTAHFRSRLPTDLQQKLQALNKRGKPNAENLVMSPHPWSQAFSLQMRRPEHASRQNKTPAHTGGCQRKTCNVR